MEIDFRSLPNYCENWIQQERFPTREVKIGSVRIGANNPIVLQSMTTTDTMDTEKTIAQSIRMIEAGCQLVRITAPSKKEAENLKNIKDGLVARGYDTPLVADIHFTPNAAEIAARIVEKVRVNPGNYADKKKFQTLEYTEESYQEELDRIRDRFIPLVKICKEHGTSMRIGTNHGSLSDRIMSRYGDTPYGMVESALEFVRICRDLDYHELVLSMKASNTQVMVQAYRLLVARMKQEGMNYPLHLGVTEAGEGEDGRIKSAVGIGTLLQDGLGDTVRVSLTEEPEAEIPVARDLVKAFSKPVVKQVSKDLQAYSPYEYTRKSSDQLLNFGGKETPKIIGDLSDRDRITAASFFPLGLNYAVKLDKWKLSDQAADYVYVGKNTVDFQIPGTLGIIQDAADLEDKDRHYPLWEVSDFKAAERRHEELNFLLVSADGDLDFDGIDLEKVVFVLSTRVDMQNLRNACVDLGKYQRPIVFRRDYSGFDKENLQLISASEFGALLLDGFGDGLWAKADNDKLNLCNTTCFGILQATRTRISKTEYISCPSCGRTLFDLQETTAKIRTRTDHLKGVKIGIMGCIVNGPGEMADADYGYVGTGVGKITLYKEKEVVKRNIPSESAVDELIDLIKVHGDWTERAE